MTPRCLACRRESADGDLPTRSIMRHHDPPCYYCGRPWDADWLHEAELVYDPPDVPAARTPWPTLVLAVIALGVLAAGGVFASYGPGATVAYLWLVLVAYVLAGYGIVHTASTREA